MIHKQGHPRTCCYCHYAANFCCSFRLYWKFYCYQKCTLNPPQWSHPFVDPKWSHMFNIQSVALWWSSFLMELQTCASIWAKGYNLFIFHDGGWEWKSPFKTRTVLWELGNRKPLYLLKALYVRLENTEGQHFMCVKFQSASNQNMGKTPNINLQAKKTFD